eukprot:TRINITY_DN19185_c0_g1_i1.p1 TRINITY_DN19185_c0_g1~~TRINITY_DN19185_c0_g1_i1.p1  ORF type:complete len:158 (-),score=31.99 TRINITY_DN19185_c0_g1_i1:144-617(-)
MVVLKRRFILFEVIFDAAPKAGALVEEDLVQAIREGLEANWGDIGEAQAQLRLIHWSPAVHLGILRCARAAAERLRAALTLLSSVRGWSAHFRVHDIGGTLRSIQRTGGELLRRWEKRAVASTSTADEAMAVKQGFKTELRLLNQVQPGFLGVFSAN